jgi:hypothetical protein
MISPTLRVYLTDFVGTDKEDEVIDRISTYGNDIPNMKLYLWFDQKLDKVDISKFVKKWDRIPHHNFKTIIRPEYFDLFRDFIWYDIVPKAFAIAKPHQYTRFAYRYTNGVDGVLEGLDNFKSTWEFTTTEKPQKRKQKRNDYEDSNRR